MQVRFAESPTETLQLGTEDLRNRFLIEQLFQKNSLQLTYSHYDRMIIGGVMPVEKQVELSNPAELRAEYFLERREMGIINVGGDGTIVADGTSFDLAKMDCLYLGKGVKSVSFNSKNNAAPALYYFLSSKVVSWSWGLHPCTKVPFGTLFRLIPIPEEWKFIFTLILPRITAFFTLWESHSQPDTW